MGAWFEDESFWSELYPFFTVYSCGRFGGDEGDDSIKWVITSANFFE
jgi:hypothetical protein